MNTPECIEVEPASDMEEMRVGDQIFGRVIMRVDYTRGLVWVRPPSLTYRVRRWLQHLWWQLRGRR